jgi:hypothetical protein
MTNEQLFEELKKQLAFQRGAWAKVSEIGRKYAQLKSNGTITENVNIVYPFHTEIECLLEQYTINLLSCEQAYAEDARTGEVISRITQKNT